jgi:DNA repair protein RecO (recombination protein O)
MKQIDHGFLLKRIPYSETSFVVSYFTLNHGIQSFLYQGGKKKGIAMFPMAFHEITFYKRPDSEMGKISQLGIEDHYLHLSFDPLKGMVAYFIAEILKQTIQTNQSESALFDFVRTKMHDLDQTKTLENFPLKFLVELSFYLGINPLIAQEENVYFNLNEGEFCVNFNNEDILYRDEASDLLLTIFLSKETHQAVKKTSSKALDYMVSYFEMHIPKCNLSKPLDLLKEILYN